MRITSCTALNFKHDAKKIENSRIDFHENHDLSKKEITVLDDKVLIGRAPGRPHYPQWGDINPDNYTFDEYTLSRDVEFLKTHCGVDTIIDLRNSKYEGNSFKSAEEKYCKIHGIKYVNIPLDGAIAPTDTELAVFFSTIDNSKGTYIHCHAGRDRTGIMSSCYLADKYGLSSEDAFKKVFEDRNVQRLKYMYGHPDEFKKLHNILAKLAGKNN